METFVKGDIVILPFPFSDLSASKKRSALVLANLPGQDIILCQITSQLVHDKFSISLLEKDLISGRLIKESNIRPNRIFTASKSIILYKAAQVSPSKLTEVRNKVVSLPDQ
ncbi:MAG: type II toxin-antitoxin system PemK/MazF family toxin [Cyclobacteriaceae bacterium]